MFCLTETQLIPDLLIRANVEEMSKSGISCVFVRYKTF